MAVDVGRFTVAGDEPVTVFLIGMRFGALHRIDKWWPVFSAMPKMLAHLHRDPETGLLGYQAWFGRTTMLLSYWRTPEHLRRFAADPDAPHAGPWRQYMRRLGNDPSVGIWHETYVMEPGRYEVIYANMPPFGLGKALGTVPIGPGSQTAKQRLGTASKAA